MVPAFVGAGVVVWYFKRVILLHLADKGSVYTPIVSVPASVRELSAMSLLRYSSHLEAPERDKTPAPSLMCVVSLGTKNGHSTPSGGKGSSENRIHTICWSCYVLKKGLHFPLQLNILSRSGASSWVECRGTVVKWQYRRIYEGYRRLECTKTSSMSHTTLGRAQNNEHHHSCSPKAHTTRRFELEPLLRLGFGEKE